MKWVSRVGLFSSNNLSLDLGQERAGQAVVQALGNRHAFRNTIYKEIDSLLMKVMSDLSELGNSVFLSLLNGRRQVLPKALTKDVAEVRKVLVQGPVVIPTAFSERCQRRRRRLLECFIQQPPGLVRIKRRPLAKPDAPPVGNAENIQRANGVRLDFSGEEFSECQIQRTCHPQIDRKHRRLLAGSPTGHRGGADPQDSRKTAQTLGVRHSPKQTGQLLPAQKGRRIECSADHLFRLVGCPDLPVWRFRRQKSIPGALIQGPCGTQPFLAASAMSCRTTLSDERLRLAAARAGQLKGTVVVGAILYDFQCPKQRHVHGLAVVAAAVEALRTPSGDTPRQQLLRQNGLSWQHCEIREIHPPGKPPHYGYEPRRSIADAVEGGSETPRASSNYAGEHVTPSGIAGQEFTMGQGAGRD
jgi:hypothetical protein